MDYKLERIHLILNLLYMKKIKLIKLIVAINYKSTNWQITKKKSQI